MPRIAQAFSHFFSLLFLLCSLFCALACGRQAISRRAGSAKAQKNPFAGQQAAVDAGKPLYARNCLACHGKAGEGTGNVPSLVDGKLKGVTAGEIFWFITKGDKDNGMPSWAFLPEEKRWQIVTYVEAMASGKAGPRRRRPRGSSGRHELKDASPTAPFTDFRYENAGDHSQNHGQDLPRAVCDPVLE